MSDNVSVSISGIDYLILLNRDLKRAEENQELVEIIRSTPGGELVANSFEKEYHTAKLRIVKARKAIDMDPKITFNVSVDSYLELKDQES